MESSNTIFQNIRIAGTNADYDAACKRLLSEKVILAWIMKNCLEEYGDLSIKEIAEKYIEGTPQVAEIPVLPDETNAVQSSMIVGTRNEDATITEGTVTYDIRFLAVAPSSGELIRLIINVEAQNDFYPGYPILKRCIYYCSRMISAQYGTEFTDSHYEKIKKVYSIWICTNPPKYRENTITHYSITEKNIVGKLTEKTENYDLMAALMICLGKPEGENYSGVLKLLNVLLSSEKAPEEKCEILENEFGIEMTKSLKREVSEMCNLSQGIVEQTTEHNMVNAIRNLMETLKLTAPQAMVALKIPKADHPKYMDMLNK